MRKRAGQSSRTHRKALNITIHIPLRPIPTQPTRNLVCLIDWADKREQRVFCITVVASKMMGVGANQLQRSRSLISVSISGLASRAVRMVARTLAGTSFLEITSRRSIFSTNSRRDRRKMTLQSTMERTDSSL